MLCYSKDPTYEGKYCFLWDGELLSAVDRVYSDRSKFYDRLAQIYSESGFNPRATSDYAGWKRQGIDTVTAIRKRMGAAGLCQFIWPTATRYGALIISPQCATDEEWCPGIYNPIWSINAMSRYMKDIERILLTTKNPRARRMLQSDRQLMELFATASYNTGEGRIRDRLNKHGASWEIVKYTILPEPRAYAEKIQRISREMRKLQRWQNVTSY